MAGAHGPRAPPRAGPPPPLGGSGKHSGAPRPPSEDGLRSGRCEAGSPRPPSPPPRRGSVYCARPSPPTAAASPRAAPPPPCAPPPPPICARGAARAPLAARSARWLSATLFPGCGRGGKGPRAPGPDSWRRASRTAPRRVFGKRRLPSSSPPLPPPAPPRRPAALREEAASGAGRFVLQPW